MVSMQVTDTRVELQKNLATWKTQIIRKIEMTHEKLLSKTFVARINLIEFQFDLFTSR